MFGDDDDVAQGASEIVLAVAAAVAFCDRPYFDLVSVPS